MSYKLQKEAARISTQIMLELMQHVEVGGDRADIDKLAGELCSKSQVKPAFRGVQGKKNFYEYNMCLGVNDDVVHSIPSSHAFRSGDIVTLDFGIIYEGYYTDHCHSFGLGVVTQEDERLLQTGRMAVLRAAQAARPGMTTGDIGHIIEEVVDLAGFTVVEQYVGHGIGKRLHLPPEIPAYGDPGTGDILQTGQTICVEAQINAGSNELKLRSDGWSEKTADGKNSVMFEFMVYLQDNSAEILTQTQDWEIIKFSK